MPKKTAIKSTTKSVSKPKPTTQKTTQTKKENLDHQHENFSKFLITVVIFLGIVVLALFSILWEQMYENGDSSQKKEKSSLMKYNN
ncbi:hypothetical protein HC864_01750 [Candidatus Gracilibacteria bacterium]|nr:hypothetical protein [Candidatus Gracilibacteria bacterium]